MLFVSHSESERQRDLVRGPYVSTTTKISVSRRISLFVGHLQVVQLPKGEDFNDWLAVHVVDFFNRINLIYGTVCEQCTDSSCPTMSGGPKFEYLWQVD
jgi:hypothetical protein